jgi:hypothetical protein
VFLTIVFYFIAFASAIPLAIASALLIVWWILFIINARSPTERPSTEA